MDRLYRLMLLAYPPALRRQHGREMTAAFAERWRAEGRGLRGRVRLVALLFADFAASLPGAWRPPDGRPGRRPRSRKATLMSDLLSDVHVALRHLRKSWVFSLSAVVTLGLGIGATTAVFSLADAALLRPMPIPEVDRVLQTTFSWSLPDFRDLEADQPVFSEVAAWTGFDVGLDRDGASTLVQALGVSGGFFDLAGFRAVRGRLLDAADDRPGAAPAVVLSERLWRRLYGADPGVVGSSIEVNQRPVTVVGIAPAWFRGFSLRERPEVFLSLSAMPAVATGFHARSDLQTTRTSVWLQIAGRLRAGVTPETARAATEQLYRRAHPAAVQSGRIPEPVTLVPLTARALGMESAADLRQFVVVLASATGVTLLLACGAVGSLLLVRTRARRREFAIRAALGGGPLRVVRLLTVESALLGLGGVAAGLLAARGTMDLLRTFRLPGNIAIGDLDVGLDAGMLAVAALAGFAATVAFSLAPLVQAARVPAGAALSEGARGSSRRPVSVVLVAAQVACCVMLLGGSLAFGRALQSALGADLGFRTTDIAMVAVDTGVARRSTGETLRLFDQVLDELASQPALASAGWAKLRPFTGAMMSEVGVPGVPPRQGHDIADRVAEANLVSPGYLETMAIPLVRGRTFAPADRASTPRVAIVSESMIPRFFGGEDPLGRQLSTDLTFRDPEQLYTVVGVVGDVQRGLGREVAATMYLLAAQHPRLMDFGGNYLFVRAADGADAGQAAQVASGVVTRIDRAVPVTSVATLDDALGETLLTQRLGLTLFLLFGVLALVLTTLGLHAIVAHAVTVRRKEIGIRLALGASSSRVLGLMARQGLVPVAAGVAFGAIGFSLAGPLLERFLFAVPAASPGPLAALVSCVLALAAAAMFVPVRHALRIQPTAALRED